MTFFSTLSQDGVDARIVDLSAATEGQLERMPVIHRILLENVLRTAGDEAENARNAILAWLETGRSEAEVPFLPSRILMHDTTCGPALVDIAGMRASLAEAGGDPAKLNPVLPVDVSTDHSLAVDVFASPDAMARNIAREYERNGERYRFVKWAQQALSNFRAHPPGTGIMHTLNLESLATVFKRETRDGQTWAIPDTLIGTDSHTPMINGIGVLGWGVGGLEAESVMFGMPVMMRVPDVIGVRLTGTLPAGVLSTDLALTITAMLRQHDLADKYVEFYGPGVSTLTAGDRAVIANMTPEFGANSGYFPVDGHTLDYLQQTGRSPAHIAFVEACARRLGVWFDPSAEPRYTDTLSLDLASVTPSLAGPQRPQDLIGAGDTVAALGPLVKGALVASAGRPRDGAVAIAAITSCTNTSDPRLLVAAGLLAGKAHALGLRPPSWVKTSMAPGSPAAEGFLKRAELLADLEALGFCIVGYGCTTCIGNSGALTPEIDVAMRDEGIVPVAVLSGNRNFPGRVHPALSAGFLASPPLVVAFALAGDVVRDILNDPIAHAPDGKGIYLADIWPTSAEIDEAVALAIDPADVAPSYAAAEASVLWKSLEAPASALFPWDEASSYIRRPPFASLGNGTRLGAFSATPLLVVGDDITTDHISPAGQVPRSSEAADYLVGRGEKRDDLNVFAARRGNWEAMLRGLFTNKNVKNLLGRDIPPGFTVHAGSGETLPLFRAAERYSAENRPVVIVAGERYGMGSSRDWAAKGVALLGVRAVLALSFERIHRSNLIGMGILPLRLPPELSPATLNLSPGDRIEVEAAPDIIAPRGTISVRIARPQGEVTTFAAHAAIETSLEVEILKAGGILPFILKRAL